MGAYSSSEHLEDDSDALRCLPSQTQQKAYINNETVKIKQTGNEPKNKMSPKKINTSFHQKRKKIEFAEIIPPNFVNLNDVLSNNTLINEPFGEYVREIKSMSQESKMHILVHGYINNIFKNVFNIIIPMETIEICYKYYKYHNAYFHDILIDEELKLYKSNCAQHHQINVHVTSLTIEEGHNLYYIKHTDCINSARIKQITIKINENIESKYKHLVLSFMHDFDQNIDINLQIELKNKHQNGSIIINAKGINIINIKSVHRNKPFIQYMPSSNVFIQCNNFHCMEQFVPISTNNTNYKDFTGNFIIECNDIIKGGNVRLYFGSIYIECNNISLGLLPYFYALNSNVIIKCNNNMIIPNFQVISFGYIYIECKHLELICRSHFVTVSKENEKTFLDGKIINKDGKNASGLIRNVHSIDSTLKSGGILNCQRKIECLNKFSYNAETGILNGILSEFEVKTNKFIYFNVDGDIKGGSYDGHYYSVMMETLTDALIIKCNKLHPNTNRC